MFCISCGHEVRTGASFCVNCGHPVTQPLTPDMEKAENQDQTIPNTVLKRENINEEEVSTNLTEENSPIELAAIEKSGLSSDEIALLKPLIGPNANYYLREFDRISRGEASLNKTADRLRIILPLYRKNYEYLIKKEFVIIPILAIIFLFIYLNSVIGGIFGWAALLSIIVGVIYMWLSACDFNNFYFTKLKKIINDNNITLENINTPEKRKVIKQKGGISLINVLAALLIPILALIMLTGGSSGVSDVSKEVSMVKNSYLNGYTNMTIGEAFDNYMNNITWEKGISEDGTVFVNATGKVMFMNKKTEAIIQFVFQEENQFEVRALELNGIPQNYLFILGFLETVYNSK